MSRGRFTGANLADDRRQRAALDDLDRRLTQMESGDIRIEASKRLIARSPNGHFWSLTVTDLGALTITDLGTSL